MLRWAGLPRPAWTVTRGQDGWTRPAEYIHTINPFLDEMLNSHLEHQEDPAEAEGDEGALYQRYDPKQGDLHDCCQKVGERRWCDYWRDERVTALKNKVAKLREA